MYTRDIKLNELITINVRNEMYLANNRDVKI